MYTGGHQRTGSNPRAYGAPDASALSARRDDTTSQGLYGGEDPYSAYQHAGYGGMSGVSGYGGYGNGMNIDSLGGYAAASSSPSAPSGSRRTSGPKIATPPQAAASATNPSPSSRYYPTAQTQAAESSGHHQSPYQPSSAPPQVLSHHHSSAAGQPQTAHPYASQYQHYYDQQGHQNSGQWANYPSASSHSYPSAGASRSSQSNTTPTIPQSATVGESHHRSSGTAGSSYDYPTASAYQWPTHEQSRSSSGHHQQQPSQQAWQQPQTASSRQSQSQSSQPTSMQQGAWQGYGGHPSMGQTMPPHHMANSQYGWQPQWNGQQYGYPPAPAHTAGTHAQAPSQPIPAPSASAAAAPLNPTGKKPKKEKKEKLPKPEKPPKEPKPPKVPKKLKTEAKEAKEAKERYKGLGKRAIESSTEEESGPKKVGRKKKEKKAEKEKAEKVPRAHPKSHLHPPRQAQSAWQLFFTDELNKAKAEAAQGNSPGGTPHHAKLNVAQIAKDAGIAYATLGEDQKKYYAEKVKESKEQFVKELAAWQATLTPEDIKAENAFRAQQRKEGKSRKGNLKDPNAPKKPLSAYFLFLKGIRENDDIRARVWGEESETTKQSVLAAEKWRSLTDDEKKPYLQQAENDKQEYEAARKVYEEEAAARARGEDIPRRPPVVPESSTHPAPAPTSLLRDDVKPHTSSDPIKPSSPVGDGNPSSESNFAGFEAPDEHESSDDSPAQNAGDYDMDEFKGFTDPLQDMDLTGLEGITAGGETSEPQWDELQKLMGTTDDGFDTPGSGKPAAAIQNASLPVKNEFSDSQDISIAPTVAEAQADSTGNQQYSNIKSEAQIQDLARQAEGVSVVPQTLPQTNPEGSGIPTEAVNELPPAGVNIADDVNVPTEVPTSNTYGGQQNIQPAVDAFSSGPVIDGV
ncbi:uncharacterized protein L201_005062 [Kwoniella dendrophila CBS 6074]|uniref:HMG box domain-containing protein n=1 Tax=Kwoniella dendrophila CBS 6074 TaxID=1295534 RepID=A0AAX4JZ60_9TREE